MWDVRTTFGRHLVAVGGNRAAARLAGLPVSRVLVSVYAISGVLAATAGVLAAARLGAGDPANTGLLFELSAIAAVVVGGRRSRVGRCASPGRWPAWCSCSSSRPP